LYEKYDEITTCAESGHHLRPDSIEIGAPYFGKSLSVRPLSLSHEQQPYCVSTLSQMTEKSAERRVRQDTGWLAGGPLLRVATIEQTTDTFLFISHTTNLLLFKFRCNIFIGVRIIKEMPGLVASGTLCRNHGAV
jgi:hypothetical protein